MRPRLGFSFNRKRFCCQGTEPTVMTRSVAAGAGRGTAWGAGGGRMASSSWWWVGPFGGFLGALVPVSFNTPKFVGVPFFWWLLKKTESLDFFCDSGDTHGFCCWVGFDTSTTWMMPCPPGDQEEAVLRCGFFVGFPWISKVKTWPQASSSSTHHKSTPPLLQPMETAAPIELSPWQHTLQPPSDFRLEAETTVAWAKSCLNPQGWYEHIRTIKTFLPAGAHRAVPQPQSAVASTSG